MADAEEQHVLDEVQGSRWPIKRKHVIAVGGIAAAGVFAAVAFHGHAPKRQTADDQVPTLGNPTPFEAVKATPAAFEVPPPPPPPKPNLPLPTAAPPALPLPQAAPADPLIKARAASPLINASVNQQTSPQATPPAASGSSQPEKETALGAKLHPTVLEPSTATVLLHPEFTITEGTHIPCILTTALDSTAPGLVTCSIQQDVYGTTGTVVLLPRGTKVVGEYGNDMRQGEDRLFVLWNRAETPGHVVINLASPAADALGRAGFGGWVDSHFLQRFGGAIMLSLIDSGFSTAAALASHGGGNNLFNFGGLGQTQSAAAEAMQGSVNIRPTLKMNQGEVVSIMLARDADFSSVYHLEMRDRR